MFWQVIGEPGGPSPDGELQTAIERDFGGLANLKDQFNTFGSKVFGSGWVFVTVDTDGKLALESKPNQDTPLMDGKRVLFGNDVWEHAYYLKYQNKRADYLSGLVECRKLEGDFRTIHAREIRPARNLTNAAPIAG